MTKVIKNGRVIDPSRGMDANVTITIEGNTVIGSEETDGDREIIDATGCWVVPGLIDAHVHLREPGHEHKEEIATGLNAAASGGFTAVLAMPNTSPPNDSPEITGMMISRSLELGGTRLYPVAAATSKRQGRRAARLADLAVAGAVAFSDDGDAVLDDAIMEDVLEVLRDLGLPLMQHAEDPNLSRGGVLHDGEVAAALGVKGWPAEAEVRIVERDIALAEKLGAHLHVSHISTMEAVELVRAAKARGARVTAEVTPHHLHLTDQVALEAGTMAKVNPPLRSREHVEACRQGLADGTIDMIATDHAPHASEDKACGLEEAAFGISGLETAVGLALLLVEQGLITPMRMVEAMSTAPARLLGLPGGTLAPGATADLTLIDPARAYTIDPERFESKGRNTPFAGWRVPGRAVQTIVGGKTVFQMEALSGKEGG